jgi:hypothetical protein
MEKRGLKINEKDQKNCLHRVTGWHRVIEKVFQRDIKSKKTQSSLCHGDRVNGQSG